ncbi:MAG: hypothetical protein MK101_12055, partial [Phycisphaerales bacterium]|nr:hypothetical protein [Phycisphaerales bacterium]
VRGLSHWWARLLGSFDLSVCFAFVIPLAQPHQRLVVWGLGCGLNGCGAPTPDDGDNYMQ